MTNEVCVCAAIKMPDGYIVRGHRHDDCLLTAGKLREHELGEYVLRYDQPDFRAAIQGFMTTENRFVGREEAASLERAAGRQFKGDILFSEDLY